MRTLERIGPAILTAACLAAMAGPSCSSGSNKAGTGDGAPGDNGGSSSGAGETSGSSGGAAGDDASGTGVVSLPDGAAGSCLGASALAALGKSRLIVGGTMADATAAMAPFDLRYEYISGGIFDGSGPCASCASGCNAGGKTCANSGGGCSWWGCYQYDQDPPGEYVRDFDTSAAKASPSQIPMFTYYQLLQASGAAEGAGEVTAAANATFMSRYFADWRFLLQQIGQSVAILHIEPDFWGYAEQPGKDAHSVAAAVATANAADCGSMENSIAGMGQCMIAMVRKYAPHALVGLHASTWGSNVDVSLNTSATLDVAGEATKVATFLAACGESSADLVIVETSDRDAGYYQTQQMKNTFWDTTNETLPDFAQDLAWVKALTEALGKPALYWQTPLGNANMTNIFLKNSSGQVTGGQWKDNRVDYFFANMPELAASHVIGAAFGGGAGDQTAPETDGGNFVAKANAYLRGAGQPLCP